MKGSVKLLVEPDVVLIDRGQDFGPSTKGTYDTSEQRLDDLVAQGEKSAHGPDAGRIGLVACPPGRSSLIWTRPMIGCTGIRKGGFSTAITTVTAICRYTCSADTSEAALGEYRCGGGSGRGGGPHRCTHSPSAGRAFAFSCAPIAASLETS
jgi:hypothetical protein